MYIQVLVLITLLVVLVFNVLYLNHVKANSLYLDRARKTNQDWVIVNIKINIVSQIFIQIKKPLKTPTLTI
jgi:hypothetical protein